MERYFVCVDGVSTLGSFTAEEVRTQLSKGEWPPQTWVQVAQSAEANPQAWDYAFSLVEFREAIPKPVVNARRRAPAAPAQVPLFDAAGEMEGLVAIVHDDVRVYEAKVAKADLNGFVLKEMGPQRLREGTRIFLHLYDRQARKSVNIWTELVNKSSNFIYLEPRELPPQARGRLQEILNRFRRLKSAA